MKKIFTIISLAVLGIALCSCEKNLDIPQKSVLSMDFYQNATPEQAEALIASVYKLYWGGRDVTSVNGIDKIIFLNSLDDDHYTGGGSFSDASYQFQDAGAYKVTASDNSMKTVYKGIYGVIYHSSLIIEEIPEQNSKEINRIKAEAHFMRALAMFDAVRWWGTPILVTHVLGPDEYYLGNTPTKESIDWILEEMQIAIDALDPIAGKGQQKAFGARISKYAAQAYRGKVQLWYASRYNDPSYLAGAVSDLKAVINSNLYELNPDMFKLVRPAGDFCAEYLFEHNADNNDGFPGDPQNDLRHMWTGWPTNLAIPSAVFSGWGWNSVSKEFGEFLAVHEGDIEKPRFKSTIHTYEQVLAMDYAPGTTPGVTKAISHNAGYFTYRGISFNEDMYNNGQWAYSSANEPMLRYAEVLLLYAEAQFLKDNDADGSGLRALNEVRRRAQIPELSSMTYQDIKDERRAELFYEQERFFDLQRWGDAPTALADKGKVFYEFSGYKPGTTEWNVTPVTGQSYNGNGWQDKYMLLPFPSEQLSANPNLKQNPGW